MQKIKKTIKLIYKIAEWEYFQEESVRHRCS